MYQAKPFTVSKEEAPAFWQVGILWSPLATGAQTGNSITLIEELCHAGSGPPTHTHEQDEGFYVLKGDCTFNAGGKTLKAKEGTFVSVPRRTPHSFSVDTDPSHLLNFYTPAGFELILMSIGVPATSLTLPPDGVPPPPRRLVEQLSRDYGQKAILGLPFADRPTPETMRTMPGETAPVPPFVSTRDEAPAYWGNDILWIMHATGEQTNGEYSVIEELCPKGSGAPPHIHGQDEMFFIIEGTARFQADGKILEGGPGSVVFIPRGTVHSFRVTSDTARLLNVYTPAGFEKVIAASSPKAERRTLPPKDIPLTISMDRVLALFEEVDMRPVALPDVLAGQV